MRAHAACQSTQPEFQNPQWPVMPAPEESGIHRGVVVGARTFTLCSRVFRSPLPNVMPSTALVASVARHGPAHPSVSYLQQSSRRLSARGSRPADVRQ